MRWLNLIIIIMCLICVNFCIEIQIVAKERSPGCNPVPENTFVILKVATNTVWDKCHWFRSNSANSTLDDFENIVTVCKQFPQQNAPPEVKLACLNNDTLQLLSAEANTGELIKSTHLSGGSAKDKQSCSLHISEIDAAMDNGFWNVAVSFSAQNATAETRDYASFQIVTNQQNDLTVLTTTAATDSSNSINAHVNSTVGQKVSLVCKSSNGSPRPRSFQWQIDDTFTFYGNWHAVLYPMQYNESNSVSQVLEVEPPSVGTFLVKCTSDQDGFYTTTANLTLSVTENDNGNGTAVLSTTWIIVISVSCGLLLIVIAVILIAFFCGICCFRKTGNEPKSGSNAKDVPVLSPPPPSTHRQMSNNNYQYDDNKNGNTQTIELNNSALQRKSESRPDVLATRSSREENYRSQRYYDPPTQRSREYGYNYDNNGYMTSPKRYPVTDFDRDSKMPEKSPPRLPPSTMENRQNMSQRSNASGQNAGVLV